MGNVTRLEVFIAGASYEELKIPLNDVSFVRVSEGQIGVRLKQSNRYKMSFRLTLTAISIG